MITNGTIARQIGQGCIAIDSLFTLVPLLKQMCTERRKPRRKGKRKMQLFRTTCTNDWKGRPSHTLVLLAESDDRAWLIQVMAGDVTKWQTECLTNLQKIWDEESGDMDHNEEHPELGKRPTQWEKNDVRWEMERPINNDDMREFVERIDECEFCTTVYHILDHTTC